MKYRDDIGFLMGINHGEEWSMMNNGDFNDDY